MYILNYATAFPTTKKWSFRADEYLQNKNGKADKERACQLRSAFQPQ